MPTNVSSRGAPGSGPKRGGSVGATLFLLGNCWKLGDGAGRIAGADTAAGLAEDRLILLESSFTRSLASTMEPFPATLDFDRVNEAGIDFVAPRTEILVENDMTVKLLFVETTRDGGSLNQR